MLKQLDRILTNIIKFLENSQLLLGRVGDYVLDFLSSAFQALLRILQRIISIIYRFLLNLIINLLKIIWRLIQISLIPVFFVFVWGFGNELRHSSFFISGLSLEVIGIGGILLFLVIVLASFVNSDADEESSTLKRRLIVFAFAVLNLIAIAVVLIFTSVQVYWFTNPILRVSQVVTCRCVVQLAKIFNDDKQGRVSGTLRILMDAAGPPPIRVGTNIAMPDRIIYVEPEIPFQARRKEALGAVALNVLLSSDGKVQSITITESVPLINEAVLQAVKQWQYKPTIYNGIAVPVVVPVRYNYIGVPIPKELVAQLKGSNAKFESSSLLTGSISNPTTWTVGVVRLMFKGPRDEKLPVKWERTCDSYIVIEPGASADFRCDLSGVDHSQSSRWYWTEAWGLPPP